MQHRTPWPRSLVLGIAVLLLGLAGGAAQAQTDQRCFPETGFCISGRIRSFWEQNGGLAVFGFPTSPQQETLIEGRPIQAQQFERNRLELHPENTPPYDVLLGRLGVDRLAQQGRDWFTFPKADPAAPHFFAGTGHAIAPQFWASWSSHGLDLDGQRGVSEAESLALFGKPISEATLETNASGATVLAQWFERARFEHHPQNAAPYDVLLGLLGNEIRDGGAPRGHCPTRSASSAHARANSRTRRHLPATATQPTPISASTAAARPRLRRHPTEELPGSVARSAPLRPRQRRHRLRIKLTLKRYVSSLLLPIFALRAKIGNNNAVILSPCHPVKGIRKKG